MSLFSQIVGGLTGVQITNPVAEQSLNAEQGVGNQSAASTGALNNQISANTNNVNAAGENVNDAAGQANGTLQQLLSGVQGNLSPALASGAQGNTQLQQYAASNPTFTAPTAADVEATPGFQFQLQQGANAITNQAAAQGLNSSGKTLADLTQYGQGLAGTYYQNAFNNAQSAFNTNQNATLNNLQALIGAGSTANQQNLDASASLGGQQATNTIGAANTNAGLQTTLAGLNSGVNTSAQQLASQAAVQQGDFATNYGQAQAGQNIGNSAAIGGGLSSLLGLLA